MSTPPPPAHGRRPWWKGWSDFWFRPTDPTTLGFIRICTGLLVLYIHLAYSFDLQAFFGEHGWYGQRYIERERREFPNFVTPFSDWDDPFVFPRLSDFPHRREEFMRFLRQTYLPDPARPGATPDPAKDLAFLFRANGLSNPDDYLSVMAYAESVARTDYLRTGARSDGAARARWLSVLAGGKAEQPGTGGKMIDTTDSHKPPAVLANLPPEDKPRVAAELAAFLDALNRVQWKYSDPSSKDDGTPQGLSYVLSHLGKDFASLPDARRALVGYMKSLTEAGPAERERLLDYFEYWNNDPRSAYRTGFHTFSVWFHVTDPTQMALIHAGVLVLIVLFTIGLFTRVTSVLVWVAVIGYIHRTQQVLFGMDTMMNILLFYLMIGNSGAALSVDRLIARYRAARASIARSGRIDANTRAFLACPPPSVSAGFAQRLIQVHFCFIYAAAGLAKLKGEMWWDGRAFWEVLVNPEFTLLHYPWYEGTVRWLAGHKPLYYFVTATAVWFTLFIEIGLPFLVWTHLRWVMVFLAVAMHAIIAVLMGLNLFELLMIVMLLAYLPDRVIRDRFRGGPDLPKFAFGFNPRTESHVKAAALAVALDVDNQVTVSPDERAAETTVAAAGSRTPGATGAAGAGLLFRGLRLFTSLRMLLWIPGVRTLLTRRLFPPAAAPAPAAGLKTPAPAAR